MMPSNNILPSKPMTEENQISSGSSRKNGSSSAAAALKPPPEQALKCPRCDSSNTKFCYYNNYSLTQPRHFCKTCRRYWTKGGALRNVPIGGGCRKNKKTKSSSRRSSDSISPSSSEDISGLKFFHGISSPSMEFPLGGGTGGHPFSSRLLHSSTSTGGIYNQFASYRDHTSTSTNNNPSFMGFNFPASSSSVIGTNGGIQEMGSSVNVHSSLGSSIEPLSCINQDLQWKLQQQRLGMLFGGDQNNQKGISNDDLHEIQTEKPQPILFQNLEISKPEASALGNQRKSGGGNPTTEWFFENTNYTQSTNIINNNNNNNNNRQGNENPSSWDGIQAWTGLNHHQYTGLQE